MKSTIFKFDAGNVSPSRTSQFFNRLTQILGLPIRLEGYSDLIVITQDGISPSTIDRLVKNEGIGRIELDWILPQRTLSHRRKNKELLHRDETEKVIRIASILASAEITFGENALAIKWLRQPNKALNGMAPLAAAQTEPGAKLVEKIMVQINEGYFA